MDWWSESTQKLHYLIVLLLYVYTVLSCTVEAYIGLVSKNNLERLRCSYKLQETCQYDVILCSLLPSSSRGCSQNYGQHLYIGNFRGSYISRKTSL